MSGLHKLIVSRDERERILYKNFVQVGQDVKAMIADISNKKNAK